MVSIVGLVYGAVGQLAVDVFARQSGAVSIQPWRVPMSDEGSTSRLNLIRSSEVYSFDNREDREAGILWALLWVTSIQLRPVIHRKHIAYSRLED